MEIITKRDEIKKALESAVEGYLEIIPGNNLPDIKIVPVTGIGKKIDADFKKGLQVKDGGDFSAPKGYLVFPQGRDTFFTLVLDEKALTESVQVNELTARMLYLADLLYRLGQDEKITDWLDESMLETGSYYQFGYWALFAAGWAGAKTAFQMADGKDEKLFLNSFSKQFNEYFGFYESQIGNYPAEIKQQFFAPLMDSAIRYLGAVSLLDGWEKEEIRKETGFQESMFQRFFSSRYLKLIEFLSTHKSYEKAVPAMDELSEILEGMADAYFRDFLKLPMDDE